MQLIANSLVLFNEENSPYCRGNTHNRSCNSSCEKDEWNTFIWFIVGFFIILDIGRCEENHRWDRHSECNNSSSSQ